MGKQGVFSRSGPESSKTVAFGKPAREPCKYLDEYELKRLFGVIKSKRDMAIFRVTYQRGLRAHEVGLIQLSDFHERDGVLHVRRGKGSIHREYSLTKVELRAVRAWLKVRGVAPGPMFPSRNRTPISRDRLDELMKAYCKLAGIPKEKAHMHALKHSCGTMLAENGATAAEIQDWLGHRSSASTDIYLHFTERRRAALAKRFEDWT